MQDIFLRVLVVGVGLIMHPREDPGVKDDDLNSSMQEWEEGLLREMERLGQEMTPIRTEVSKDRPDGPFVNLKSQEESTESEINHEETQIDTISLLIHLEATPATQNDPEITHENANHIASLGQLDIADSDDTFSQEDPNRLENDPRSLEISQKDCHTVSNINEGNKQEEKAVSFVIEKTDTESRHYFSNQQTLPGQKKVFKLEKSVRSSDQEVKLPQPLADTAANDHTDKATNWENDYMWFLLNTYSTISVIHFLYKYLRRNSQSRANINTSEVMKISNVRNLSTDVTLPNNNTLHRFYNKCVHFSPSESGRIGEFVEGLANDLLEAMRNMTDKKGGMVMEDVEVVEAACGPVNCKIIIPFHPFEPHSFQCQPWNSQAGERPHDTGLQGWYRIKMIVSVNKDACPCGSSNTGEDFLCLLHCEKENVGELTEVFDSPLCQRNTPYLSTLKVKQWFQNEIKSAWEHISHKYELRFSYKGSTATVRFRSGKTISFQMAPAIKLHDTEAYFTIASCSTDKATSEMIWSPSLTIYENRFLKHLEKRIPKVSCHIQSLNIVLFLNMKQTSLTGSSALKHQHYKTALLHLLATKEPSAWHPENMASRIRDLFSFVENCLQKGLLYQICLKNPVVPKEIEMPATSPVNLFHPLVVQNELYIRTLQHFQEMLKNTPMIIQEYLSSD